VTRPQLRAVKSLTTDPLTGPIQTNGEPDDEGFEFLGFRWSDAHHGVGAALARDWAAGKR
jgi:hypothetical protein